MIDLRLGDCLEVMPTLAPDSVDAIVTDPPYGLGFMGKNWDHGVPGVQFWIEALRVAKPGAHLLAFGGTRTFHRLTVAIEDAGWEIRDTVMWVYGSGFPKSHDVSKAIDKSKRRDYVDVAVKLGIVLPDNSHWDWTNGEHSPSDAWWEKFKQVLSNEDWKQIEREVIGSEQKKAGWFTARNEYDITASATPAAQQWDGWGTALKPAWEPIIVARKPLIGTVAQNVLAYGTGGINVDAGRVSAHDGRPLRIGDYKQTDNNTYQGRMNGSLQGGSASAGTTTEGRWPANVIHDGSEEVAGLFPVTSSGGVDGVRKGGNNNCMSGPNQPRVYENGRQPDSGSAARFFYCAKASKADRDEGLDGFELRTMGRNQSSLDGGKMLTGSGNEISNTRRNTHPTVKPTDLMRYLCKLVTQPGGVILDPFMGSGSTGKAAALEGFGFIGIDREPEYLEIARSRIGAARNQTGLDSLPLFQQADL